MFYQTTAQNIWLSYWLPSNLYLLWNVERPFQQMKELDMKKLSQTLLRRSNEGTVVVVNLMTKNISLLKRRPRIDPTVACYG